MVSCSVSEDRTRKHLKSHSALSDIQYCTKVLNISQTVNEYWEHLNDLWLAFIDWQFIAIFVVSCFQLTKERPDNHSDTSGETIQSDSGVGISEGETRSTMSHSHHTGRGSLFSLVKQIGSFITHAGSRIILLLSFRLAGRGVSQVDTIICTLSQMKGGGGHFPLIMQIRK
jgi:hypothetical protein